MGRILLKQSRAVKRIFFSRNGMEDGGTQKTEPMRAPLLEVKEAEGRAVLFRILGLFVAFRTGAACALGGWRVA